MASPGTVGARLQLYKFDGTTEEVGTYPDLPTDLNVAFIRDTVLAPDGALYSLIETVASTTERLVVRRPFAPEMPTVVYTTENRSPPNLGTFPPSGLFVVPAELFVAPAP